jgi:succinate dehydrogenase/fumarate reductase flavoprotein subunit
VRAESKGSQINIKAKKGVVLANGGYSSNTQMLKILNLPGIYTATMNSPANSGDGQRMGQKVGARLWDIAMGAESSLCALKLPSQIYDTAVQYNGEISPGFIFVDKTGNRFMNEYDLTTWSHYKGHLAVFDFKGDFIMPPTQNEYLHIPFFAIFDDKHRRSGSLAGNLGGAWGRMGWFASQRLYDWSADNSAEIAKGWIVEADTIQELATKIKGTDHKGAQISVDAEGLQETVDKFNEYCAAGVDSSFGRAAMSPIDTPPYYGAELCIQTQYTTGGLKHDAQCRTLDLDDKPIPRLYSAGDVGHIGIIKPDGVCGAMAFGRVAGKQVAALEPWG